MTTRKQKMASELRDELATAIERHGDFPVIGLELDESGEVAELTARDFDFGEIEYFDPREDPCAMDKFCYVVNLYPIVITPPNVR